MSEAFDYDDGADAYEPEERADAQREPVDHDDGGAEREEQPQQRERRPDPNRAAARMRVEQRELRDRLRAAEERAERLERARDSDKPAVKDPYAAMLDIDAEKDPIGGILAAQELVRTMNAERQQTAAQEQAQQRENQRVATLANWADAHIEDFKETHADFDKAVEHVAAGITKEQKSAGANDQEASQAVARYILGIIERAKERGKDPAAALYAIAGTRGYSAKVDNEGDMAQQNNSSRGTSPFAGKGIRSGGGGVSMKAAAEAPKSSPRSILKGGDDFDKRFAGLRAQVKGR